MTGSRPDISFAMMSVSKYLNNPGLTHLNAAKRILRYVKETRNYGLVVNGRSRGAGQLKVFVDSAYSKGIDTIRSVSGYVIMRSEIPLQEPADCGIIVVVKCDRNLAGGASPAARLRERDGPDDSNPTSGHDIKTIFQDLACDKTSE
ncbi:Gag-pol Polyprotein [Phytophthora megakarya]|uniref:Gag-pol Polyprotein n=1 Tax=Phytophthora megakarya TaxID=4795 RepID=A0A225UDX4_9STRA|nr:Gag-pol Polyprotein [Phytophthora megakarya]